MGTSIKQQPGEITDASPDDAPGLAAAEPSALAGQGRTTLRISATPSGNNVSDAVVPGISADVTRPSAFSSLRKTLSEKLGLDVMGEILRDTFGFGGIDRHVHVPKHPHPLIHARVDVTGQSRAVQPQRASNADEILKIAVTPRETFRETLHRRLNPGFAPNTTLVDSTYRPEPKTSPLMYLKELASDLAFEARYHVARLGIVAHTAKEHVWGVPTKDKTPSQPVRTGRQIVDTSAQDGAFVNQVLRDIGAPRSKLAEFRDNLRHMTMADVKRSLRDVFNGAAAGTVVFAGAKMTTNTLVRAIDHTGIGAALAGGFFCTAYEIRKDYILKQKNYSGEAVLSFRAGMREVWQENNKKYWKKFATGSVCAFATSWGLHALKDAGVFDLVHDKIMGTEVGKYAAEKAGHVFSFIKNKIDHVMHPASYAATYDSKTGEFLGETKIPDPVTTASKDSLKFASKNLVTEPASLTRIPTVGEFASSSATGSMTAGVAPDGLAFGPRESTFASSLKAPDLFAGSTINAPVNTIVTAPVLAPAISMADASSVLAAPTAFENYINPPGIKPPYQPDVLRTANVFNFSASVDMPASMPAAPLSAMDELASLGKNVALTAHAQETIKAALAGKAYAMNEAIDGLLNDRFGFEENRELAIKLTKQLAAAGDAEGRLKLAFMQYQGNFEGVAHDPKAALATIKDLGRSWTGGEALLAKVGAAAQNVVEQASPAEAPAAPISMTIDPEAVVPDNAQQAVSCTMTQLDTDGVSIKCDAPKAAIAEGNFISLKTLFKGGVEKVRKLLIDAIPAGVSGGDYLEKRMAAEAAMFDPRNP